MFLAGNKPRQHFVVRKLHIDGDEMRLPDLRDFHGAVLGGVAVWTLC